MTKRRVLVFFAVFLAAGGLVFLGRSLYRVTTPASPQRSFQDTANRADVEALESVRQYLTPQSPEDRAELPNQLVKAARSTSPSPRELALLEVFRQRMAILVDPTFDKYIEHVAYLTGKTPETVRRELGNDYQRRWEASAKIFEDASFGLDGCQLLPGQRDLIPAGGQITSRKDPGVYQTGSLLSNTEVELARIQVPLILPVDFDGNPRTVLLYLVSGFVWDEARSTWLPYVTGLYDPTSQEDIIPAPWI